MPAKARKARTSILKSHSFYIRIVTIFVGLLLVTVLPIISYNYSENKRVILEMSDDLMNQAAKLVVEKASAYFLPATVVVEMSSKLVRLGVISFESQAEVEAYTLGVLLLYPQAAMCFVADEKGNYVRGWRRPDGSMETRVINTECSPPKNQFRCYSSSFELLESHEAETIDYDPRTRPWYIGAKANRSNYWTDMYVSFRNKKPTITSSYPVMDDRGNVLGVWGMDIELDEISGFLKSLRIGKNGFAFLMNEKFEIMAYPDSSLTTKEMDGELRPILLDELEVEHVSMGHREHLSSSEAKVKVRSQGEDYFVWFSEFPKTFPVHWKIVMVVPEDEFTGSAKELILKTAFICSFIFIMAILLAIFVARGITRPILLLSEETKKIKNFDLEEKVEIKSRVREIQFMGAAISAMKAGLLAFRRYVPAELVRHLINTGEEARLGGQKKDLSVFFSDIAGFTTIAERMSPEDLMVHLSEYFDELTRILSAHRGTVDKYIGDAILAFWGAPVPDEDHAYHACAAALACREKIMELNRRWESEGKSPFLTRIGISTGETLVGNVGSSERINYTVMGDTVNLASRLEGANKFYHTDILVSHETYTAVSDRFRFRLIGITAVKGKTRETRVYELAGVKDKDGAGPCADLCGEFTRGVEAYLSGQWEIAYGIFHDLSLRFPQDAPTAFYLARCRHFREHPPGTDWWGIEHLETK